MKNRKSKVKKRRRSKFIVTSGVPHKKVSNVYKDEDDRTVKIRDALESEVYTEGIQKIQYCHNVKQLFQLGTDRVPDNPVSTSR